MKRLAWAALFLGLALAATPVHVVQPGETLYRIAKTYGVPLETLAAANGIADVNLIRVGQRLVIPSEPSWPADWGLSVVPWPPEQGRPAVFHVPEGVEAVRVFGLEVPVAAAFEVDFEDLVQFVLPEIWVGFAFLQHGVLPCSPPG